MNLQHTSSRGSSPAKTGGAGKYRALGLAAAGLLFSTASLPVHAQPNTVPPAAPATAAPAPAPQLPVDSIPRLRDAYKGKFLVGAALSGRVIRGEDARNHALAVRHFDSYSPENDLKPQSLQPTEGNFNFTVADQLVDLAEKNGATVLGHCLVWHSQTPQWFFRGPDGGPAGRELALKRMRDHIKTVVGRYKGRIKQWDVVNEAISDNRDEVMRRSPWLANVGPDFILEAFKAAHEADPDAILIYNDYNIETGQKHQKALLLLKQLIDQGAPINGVGIQGHWGIASPSIDEIETGVKNFGALGLKVMITELDISVLPSRNQSADISIREVGAPGTNPYTQGLPANIAQWQATRYYQLFAMLLRHKDFVNRVTLWGVDDGTSWKNNFPIQGRTDYTLIFDRQGNPKPAFYGVMKAAQDDTAAAKRQSR